MKKLSICLLLILLISMLVLPVFAAQSANMAVSANKTTLTPGETFTISVSTSAVENCTGGGFQFSYDTNVFEYLIGSASVGGFSSAEISGMSGYFSGGTATVQGTIFQITLQVKDNAPLGSYYISGYPTLTALNEGVSESVSCSAGGVTVTVACDHAWSAWTGTEATCGAPGSLSRTCSKCNTTETDTPAATGLHNYSNWSMVDDTQHKRTCAACASEEVAGHNWEISTVHKQANCVEEGSVTYSCTDCAATKTEVVPVQTTHTYDHDCDTDCNICGATRTTEHQYNRYWSMGRTGHWVECVACKDRIHEAAHTPGPDATETTPQVCTICTYIIQAALGHKHNFATEWTTDENGHWYACSGCNEKGSYADHDFENDCDSNCSVCDYTRNVEHAFDENWYSDESIHWQECSGCGVKQNEAAHDPVTVENSIICSVCDYEISTIEPTDPTTETTPSAIDQTDDATFPWWIVLVCMAIGAAGIVFVISTSVKKS